MPAVSSELRTTPLTELTRAVVGAEMTMADLLEMLESEDADPREPGSDAATETRTWAGSVGYENYREVDDFADQLVAAGVEQLIDVRELPISRRRGYAKSALGTALGERGIAYVHMRALGNPKAIRDLWRSGAVEEGRGLYREHLLGEGDAVKALSELTALLRAKRSAVMCFEHDEDICHRQVIFECLREQLGVDLATERLFS